MLNRLLLGVCALVFVLGCDDSNDKKSKKTSVVDSNIQRISDEVNRFHELINNEKFMMIQTIGPKNLSEVGIDESIVLIHSVLENAKNFWIRVENLSAKAIESKSASPEMLKYLTEVKEYLNAVLTDTLILLRDCQMEKKIRVEKRSA